MNLVFQYYFNKCSGILTNFFLDNLQKEPLFVGGTESSDRSNFNGEPPFLSGTMVRRDLIEHSSKEKTEDIYGDDNDTSESGE